MNNNERILPTVDRLKSNWENVKNGAAEAAEDCRRDPREIKVIAVSKTHPLEMIKRALKAGITVFGENYAQELRDKHTALNQASLPEPEWHFIGHLQRNKVKYIAPFINMIHSVDSAQLAREISKHALKNNRIIDILLQVNTSGEESKSGCEPDDIFSLAESVLPLENLKIHGLMTIGTFSNEETIIRSEFRLLRSLRDKLASEFPGTDFHHLSMGMTSDYPIAIEEGATMVRVGTAIFGHRY